MRLRAEFERLPHYQFAPHPLTFEEVRIENTNRCGYHCFFCPREELTRTQGFMPMEDLTLVLDRVGHHEGIVDLHGFGEPLLDKQLPAKIALVAARWPEAQSRIFSTLGVKVKPDYFDELASAGLRYIEVSFYGFDPESYQQAHGIDRFDLARENLTQLCAAQQASGGRLEVAVRSFPRHDAIKQPGASPERIAAFHDWLGELGVTLFHERDLHNYGSGRSYNAPRSDTPCSVVWGYRRRILQVSWDLTVTPCCFDFNGEIKLGNLRHQTLVEILGGPVYTQFIQHHIDDRLEQYPVCMKCDRCFMP